MSRIRLSNFTFTFHLHALEKEMATHSSVLAWRIPGMGEPGGLPSGVAQSWTQLKASSLVRASSWCEWLEITRPPTTTFKLILILFLPLLHLQRLFPYQNSLFIKMRQIQKQLLFPLQSLNFFCTFTSISPVAPFGSSTFW